MPDNENFDNSIANKTKILKPIKDITIKYKKIIIIAFIIWGLFAFGLGNIIGIFFISKANLSKFPALTKEDKILILAPHIDDEIIATAGIIQEAKSIGSQVKIVYFTNGDGNVYSIFKKEKNLRATPDDFIKLGAQRMEEGKTANKILGLNENDLIFLSYPDQGLASMLGKNYETPYTSKTTKFNFDPYEETYRAGKLYTGANVTSDLISIFNDFKPTIIIIPHPRDLHPDHWAVYQFLKRTLMEVNFQGKIFAYLVHYHTYPAKKGLFINDFYTLLKNFFSQTGWVSFNLSAEQEKKKLEAVNANKTQLDCKSKGFFKKFC